MRCVSPRVVFGCVLPCGHQGRTDAHRSSFSQEVVAKKRKELSKTILDMVHERLPVQTQVLLGKWGGDVKLSVSFPAVGHLAKASIPVQIKVPIISEVEPSSAETFTIVYPLKRPAGQFLITMDTCVCVVQ